MLCGHHFLTCITYHVCTIGAFLRFTVLQEDNLRPDTPTNTRKMAKIAHQSDAIRPKNARHLNYSFLLSCQQMTLFPETNHAQT